MGTLILFIALLWFMILIVDSARGKFLHKGKKKRYKIFLAHTFICTVLLTIGAIIEAPDPVKFSDYRFSTANLNVRSGPSTNADINEPQLEPGEKIFVLQDSAGWLAISRSEYDSTLSGWVAKSYTLPMKQFRNWGKKQDSLKEIEEKYLAAQEKKQREKEAAQKKHDEERREFIESRRAQKESLKSEAFVMSQKFVKKYLKSPSSADFPFLDYSAEHIYGSVYLINSYVDSQNSYGAMIRTDYRARLRKEGETWYLESLMFDGEFVYKE